MGETCHRGFCLSGEDGQWHPDDEQVLLATI